MNKPMFSHSHDTVYYNEEKDTSIKRALSNAIFVYKYEMYTLHSP